MNPNPETAVAIGRPWTPWSPVNVSLDTSGVTFWQPLPGGGHVREHGHAIYVRGHCRRTPDRALPAWLDGDMRFYAQSLLNAATN